jgi:hypothetical protein
LLTTNVGMILLIIIMPQQQIIIHITKSLFIPKKYKEKGRLSFLF